MKNDIVLKSICIAGTFVLILLVVIFTAIYSHWDDQNSQALKDSLSTTSGIFGGLATLAAAIVAAYLFNDWREEKSFDYKLNKIESLLFDLDTLIVKINQFSYPIIAFYDNHNRQVLLNNHIHYKYHPSIELLSLISVQVKTISKILNNDDILKIHEIYESKIIHVRELIDDFYLAYNSYTSILKTKSNGSDRVYILNDNLTNQEMRSLKEKSKELMEIINKETVIKYTYSLNENNEKESLNMLYHVQEYIDHSAILTQYLRSQMIP